jgi:hypothetical protein
MENIKRKHQLGMVSLGMVSQTCNPNTQEAEAGGRRVQDQLRLHSETLSQKKKRKKKKRKNQ